MSILSQLLKKQITFPQAEQKIEEWFVALVDGSGADADLQAAENAMKQAASNALGYAGTAAAAYMTPAVTALEGVVDAAITAATKGVATPAIPLVNAGLDQLGNMLHAVIDAGISQAKASLQTEAADSAATPPPAPQPS